MYPPDSARTEALEAAKGGRDSGSAPLENPSLPITGDGEGGLRTRAAASLSDQAFSSLTNFVIVFGAFRSLELTALGEFTLAYAVTQLVLSVVRSLVLEPLTIRFTVADPTVRLRATRSAAGTSLVIGLAALVVATVAAFATHSHMQATIVAVGVILPILLLQDAWRFHLFAAGRPWAAAANDASCLVGTIIVILPAITYFSHTATLFIVIWGFGAVPGLLLGLLQVHTWPRVNWALAWLRYNRDLGPHLAAERGLEFGATQLALILVAAIGGLAATGRLGGALTLMSPATTLISGMYLFAVPEASRVHHSKPPRLVWFVVGITLATVCGIGVYSLALAFAPSQWGETVLGENWTNGRSLLLPIAIWMVAVCVRNGASIGLRALGRGRLILALSALTAPAIVVGVLFGLALLGGANGAAWGFATVYCAAVAVWWVTYLRVQPRVEHAIPTGQPRMHLK